MADTNLCFPKEQIDKLATFYCIINGIVSNPCWVQYFFNAIESCDLLSSLLCLAMRALWDLWQKLIWKLVINNGSDGYGTHNHSVGRSSMLGSAKDADLKNIENCIHELQKTRVYFKKHA